MIKNDAFYKMLNELKRIGKQSAVIKVILHLIIMSNEEIIKDVRESFGRLISRRYEREVKSEIASIVRQINRLQFSEKTKKILASKIAADVGAALASETAYFNLNNPPGKSHGMKVRVEYSDGFYRSIEILREELFKLIDKQE